MADLAFVLIPLLMYVAVPVGIAIGITILYWRVNQKPTTKTSWILWVISLVWLNGCCVYMYFYYLPRLFDWLWYMAFGGWAGMGR